MANRCFALSLCLVLVVTSARGEKTKSTAKKRKATFIPTENYKKKRLQGWTVYVNKRLLKEEAETGREAMQLLDTKLYEVRRLMSKKVCDRLQKVPIWLGVDDGHGPCAEYHPNEQWLRSNGYNPDKAKAVEIGNASRFLKWSKNQPAMVLHELAHAYHDQVLGFNHPAIKAAFDSATESKKYQKVLHINGRSVKHYALTSPQEYFAEGTEAFFATNDFYPFVRAELKEHDPRLFKLLQELWGK